MSTPSATVKFSTAAYSDKYRVEAWRELFGHAICGLDIDPLPGHRFQSETTLRILPGLGVATGSSSGAHYWRPASRIESDDLVFVINHEGRDLARMSGREEILMPGHAIMFASDQVGGNANAGASRFTTLRIPRSSIAADGDAILRPITPCNPALRLLTNYLDILRDKRALQTASQQRNIASHIHDLIAMTLRPQVTTTNGDETDGIAAARFFMIKRDIQQNALDPNLNITSIARRHGITPRYVQILFARTGTQFSDYVRTVRLAAAYNMLIHSAKSHRSVGQIATDVGFTNASYFNRAFRREFNATPSEVRNERALRYEAGDA